MKQESLLDWLHANRKGVIAYCLIISFMVTLMVSNQNRIVYSSVEDIDQEVNTTLADNLETYAGIFSTTVTASVNPTATLAILSILGTIENAPEYAPNSKALMSMATFLNKVPIVREVSALPISNPVAVVLLSLIAVVMIILHSTTVTKNLSAASVDKLERWGGFIVTAAFSLMPLATTQVAAVAAEGSQVRYVSLGTYIITLLIAILSAIFNSIVYFCVHKCIDVIELICAEFPIAGDNGLEQLLKALLHVILILCQIFARPLSIAFSIIIALLGLIFVHKLSMVADYYTYIYVKPLWNRIFHRKDPVPLLHRKFPRKGEKNYPDAVVAIPVFSMVKLRNVKLRKKEMAWLLVKDDQPYVVKLKPFHKVREVPLADLSIRNDILYLQKNLRFTRIMTEDKQVELIISNEYLNQWDYLLSYFNLADYQTVIDARKAAKEAARQQKKQEWEDKKTAFKQKVIDKKNAITDRFSDKEEVKVIAKAEETTAVLDLPGSEGPETGEF